MRILLAVAFIALAGCARPPEISTSLDMEKKAAGLIVVKLKVANAENRPTTPIAIEVIAQARTGGRWQKPTPVLTPAAFVLNRREQRELLKYWQVEADAVRATLVIKEQETGHVLKSEKAEKTW